MDYIAYGLQLRSSFALPGLPPRSGTGLPALALELVDATELASAWSGGDGSPAWHGLLGDGLELSAQRGAGGDLLFTYGARARFRLDPDERSLACAPSRAGLEWQRVLLTKVLACVSVLRGYEALHASAVDSPAGAVVIAGPSGAGKTTLALELMRRGWPLLSDDVLALRAHGDTMHAHPGTPHMNLVDSPSGPAPSFSPDELCDTLGTLSGETWVAARAVPAVPRPLAGICLLARGADLPLGAHALAPHPLALAPYMLGLFEDDERVRRRFALYADLASSTPLIRLTCGAADRPADVVDLVESALVERPTALAAAGAR